MADLGYRVGVHWIRCSFPEDDMSAVVSLMVSSLGDGYEIIRGRWGYACAYNWSAHQSHISYDGGVDRGHRGRGVFEITGKALDGLDREGVCGLLRDLEAYRCTRLDLFIDDMERRIELDEVLRCHEEKRVSGPRKGSLCRDSKAGELTSYMISFGRRGKKGSGRFWRFYDKALESLGRNPAIRIEVELTEAKSDDALPYLLANMDTFEESVGRLVTTGIDFFEVKNKNLARGVRCPWWQEVLDSFPALKYHQPVKVATLESTIAWLLSAVAPSFGMLRKGLGYHGFIQLCNNLADSGSTRLSEKHWRILRELHRS